MKKKAELDLGSAMIQLVGKLAVDAGSATPGCHCIITGVSLEAILVAHFSSQKQERNAGSDEREEDVQASALTGFVGALAEEAAPAECAAKT